MKIKYFCIFLIITFSVFHAASCQAVQISHSGQISAFGSYNDNLHGQMGIRYIPKITFIHNMNEELSLDAELSLNLDTFTSFDSLKELEDNADADLYRSWIRFSSNRYEVRLGLQRINFGPARILRSLRWFDQLDPRDPLNLTEGVYAMLYRYYFQNNSNIWLWGLYGNDDLKGLETLKTDKDRPEFGFRYQFPVSRGEMAFTYHNRHIRDKDQMEYSTPGSLTQGREERYAIDGIFDLGPGLWFEAVYSHMTDDKRPSNWTRYLTMGIDYTFDTGPGVHILGEHFIRSSGSGIFRQDNDYMTSAISVDLSSGILDTITTIIYFDWQNDEFYPNLSWRRTYDNLLVNITAFYNNSNTANAYSGTGVLITLSYNY